MTYFQRFFDRHTTLLRHQSILHHRFGVRPCFTRLSVYNVPRFKAQAKPCSGGSGELRNFERDDDEADLPVPESHHLVDSSSSLLLHRSPNPSCIPEPLSEEGFVSCVAHGRFFILLVFHYPARRRSCTKRRITGEDCGVVFRVLVMDGLKDEAQKLSDLA